MRVSDHFIRAEFACECGCNFDCVDKTLVETLERVREHFKNKYPNKTISIRITSGNRCREHNIKVGGAANSYHTKGMAADFQVKDVAPSEVQAYLLATFQNWFGIGSYAGWTHLDTRSTPARWHG